VKRLGHNQVLARGHRNWPFPLSVIVVCTLFLSTTVAWGAAAERNQGMIYAVKGLVGSARAAFYLSTAEHVLGQSQFAGGDDFRRLAYLAELAIVGGDWELAEQLVSRTVSSPKDRGWELALLVTALAWEREGDFGRCSSVLEWSQIPDPHCHLLGAKKLEYDAQLDQAETLYYRAVELAPANAQARRALASFLEEYRHDRAAAVLQHEIAVELDPTPENMLALARWYTTDGRFDEAVGLIDRVQIQFPGSDENSAIERWRIVHVQGDHEGALRTLELAHRRFPDSPRIWQRLAETYEAMGRTEDALSAAQQAIVLDPEWIWAYWRMAQILLAHNRPAEAATYLDRMLEFNIWGSRMEVLSLIDLGTAYLQMGRSDLALRSFCQAQDLNRWGERTVYIEQQIQALGECDAR